MIVHAVDAGVTKLYHYQQFCPAYLADTLANQRVHVSNPETFNDPWDCYPCFDTTRVIDPGYRARCITRLRQYPLPHLTAAKRLYYETMMQADSDLFTRMLQTTFRDSVRNMVVARWRVYCLTPHSDKSLMWSHYSNHHQGICLEFDTSQPVIGGAFQVGCRDALPALDVLEISGEAAFQIFVTKSPDWHYEDEYRILARDGEGDEAPHLLPTTTKDFLPLPPGALTGIIAGCRADFSDIKAVVEQHAPGLPVKRAV